MERKKKEVKEEQIKEIRWKKIKKQGREERLKESRKGVEEREKQRKYEREEQGKNVKKNERKNKRKKELEENEVRDDSNEIRYTYLMHCNPQRILKCCPYQIPLQSVSSQDNAGNGIERRIKRGSLN